MVIPPGADDGSVRKRMLDEFGLEIGAGLGPMAGKIWRIGLMGHSSNPKNVECCLMVLEKVLGGTLPQGRIGVK
ncbi:MAG: alanine--glyoxylate aminotransferase [Deltaproteobacteria bacterium]|nr:alanine--glyoxylate aminotransferase [Deltaproteobacteria bacterium]